MLNNRFLKAFELHLKKEKERTTYNPNSYTKTFTIFFYEWSNTSNAAKVFDSYDSFKKFCEECNIEIPAIEVSVLKYGHCVYCSCKPNLNVLTTAYTKYGLDSLLKRFESTAMY